MDEIEIRFNPAAFKHTVSEADIRFAIEIIYNVIDEQTINVFHAKTCRKTYLGLLDK